MPTFRSSLIARIEQRLDRMAASFAVVPRPWGGAPLPPLTSGRCLQWCGVVVRGGDVEGREVRIDPECISQGMRSRAQEMATPAGVGASDACAHDIHRIVAADRGMAGGSSHSATQDAWRCSRKCGALSAANPRRCTALAQPRGDTVLSKRTDSSARNWLVCLTGAASGRDRSHRRRISGQRHAVIGEIEASAGTWVSRVILRPGA